MSFITRAQHAFSVLAGREQRGWTVPEPWITPWGQMPASIPVDRKSALGVATVWACIRILTGTVSRMPIDVLIDVDGHPTTYPAPRWLKRPILENPNFGRIEHFAQVMMSLLFEGNFFTLTVRDNSNDVSELYNLDPAMVEITGPLSAPGYKVRTGSGQSTEYTPAEILHRPLMSLPGLQRGVAPIEAARMVFGVGLAGQEFAGRFFNQDATPSGVIQVPQGTKVTVDELKKNWESHHQGLDNAHRPGVLTGGATWQSIGINAEQSQFLQQRQFSVTEIARFYGVPPHMVGDVDRTTSWGKGIEQQGISFTTYSLNDYLVLIEEAYRSLVPNPNSYLRFNRNALLRGDSAARADFYQKLFAVGAMSPDDIRAKEDLAPLSDGQGEVYFVPVNFGPLEQALTRVPTPGLPEAAPPQTGADQNGPDEPVDSAPDIEA
jgi:HK97 family phage portal protein